MTNLLPWWAHVLAGALIATVFWWVVGMVVAAWAGTRSRRERELEAEARELESDLDDAYLALDRREDQLLPWAMYVAAAAAQDMARLDESVDRLIEHRSACARVWGPREKDR